VVLGSGGAREGTGLSPWVSSPSTRPAAKGSRISEMVRCIGVVLSFNSPRYKSNLCAKS